MTESWAGEVNVSLIRHKPCKHGDLVSADIKRRLTDSSVSCSPCSGLQRQHAPTAHWLSVKTNGQLPVSKEVDSVPGDDT